MAEVLKTLKTSGGDYADPILWESTEQTNLVEDGDNHVLEISSGSFDGPLILAGWVTGTNNRITIRAASDSHHEGVRYEDGGNGARLLSDTSGATLWLSQNDVDIQDIELKTEVGSGAFALATTGDCGKVERNIIYNSSGAPTSYCVRVFYANTKMEDILNNYIISDSGRGVNFNDAENSSLSSIFGMNLIRVGDYPVVAAGTVIMQNTAIFSDIPRVTGGAVGTDYNASNGTVSRGSNNQTIVITDGTDFVEPSTFDYRKVVSGNLHDTGTDLSAYSTLDIKRKPRKTNSIGPHDEKRKGFSDLYYKFILSGGGII